MKINKQARREGKQLFRSCLVNGLLDEDRARKSVAEVLARKPRGYLPLLSHFQRLVKLDVYRRTATVESAIPLAPATQNHLETNLANHYGRGLKLTFRENGALIGGLRVQVGSDVFDGSIQSRLARLADSFNESH